jgi:enamine deaminase RidA (YjgF/YER057c/UK114 family)
MVASGLLPSGRLLSLGWTLPPAPAPVGSYVPARVRGDLVFVTGQLAFVDGLIVHPGLLGDEVTADEGAEAARVCALNAISAAADAVGGVDQIGGVLQIVGYLGTAAGFTGHSAVLNGASDALAAVFGDEGRHTRTNVGVSTLPLRSPIELQVTFFARSV